MKKAPKKAGGRGGKREGAGRPESVKTVVASIRCTPEAKAWLMSWLDSQAKGAGFRDVRAWLESQV